jgi:hypothetical protein
MKMPRTNRSLALSARPEQVACLEQRQTQDGGTAILMHVQRPAWQRFFGGPALVKRTFELDAFGREVYEACNGQQTVDGLIRAFSTSHQVSLAEAEIAMTQFLKTLMTKGLIAMAVDKKSVDQEAAAGPERAQRVEGVK